MPAPEMTSPAPMDPSMPAMPPGGVAPAGPAGLGPEDDMIMLHRSTFEDLKEILSGIMTGIDEILSAEHYKYEGGEGEAGEMEGEMPAGAGAPPSKEDEEFLKSMMAEGSNRAR